MANRRDWERRWQLALHQQKRHEVDKSSLDPRASANANHKREKRKGWITGSQEGWSTRGITQGFPAVEEWCTFRWRGFSVLKLCTKDGADWAESLQIFDLATDVKKIRRGRRSWSWKFFHNYERCNHINNYIYIYIKALISEAFRTVMNCYEAHLYICIKVTKSVSLITALMRCSGLLRFHLLNNFWTHEIHYVNKSTTTRSSC